ncbi:hypothetical protein [Mesorhizobium sangaii]|uniref:Toprim domain-containing protein n=1 Tax=Mesorhizobium sangaii TaxID=505389 RepID=A0A841NXE9_9HYPH|nr:hypothetical protein [Mesorhizobium sangaii]MBB6407646.1 hypothetical protein [Mesorhizobium sangaii]
MRIDYQGIKQLADEIGCRVTDLIALSPGNDPFYAGVSGRREAAEWFASLWVSCGWLVGSHPRRLHYNAISQDPPILKPNGEPYQNTENDWKFFSVASLGARYLRLIPDGALADHRNDPPIINAVNNGTVLPSCDVGFRFGAGLEYSIPDREVYAPYLTVEPGSLAQPFLVELWVEKSTQNDILIPLAGKFEFNLVAGTGETSEVLARQAVERAVDDRRPMRILYVSDFDPGGRSMPVALARKIEFWIREADLDLDVTLNPIVLTPEQCEQYRLPRTPLKETERRAAKFEERFGAGATELDALEALHPGELANVVTAEVSRYFDPTLASRERAARAAFERIARNAQASVHENFDISDIQRRYADLVENFKASVNEIEADTEDLFPQIADELDAITPTFDPAAWPEPRPATPPASPLFDSRRDYLDQIDHYRRWQGKGGADGQS